MKKYFLLFLMLFSFISYLFPQNLQSPEQFLGYKVGDDYKLADYESILSSFQKIQIKLSTVKSVKLPKAVICLWQL